MAHAPAYVILGRGRWAKKIQPVIVGENRIVTTIDETRQRPFEAESAYVSRLSEGMKSSGAQIAWLCVSPGPHVSLTIQAALDAGLHVIVEKPWYGSAEDTERLEALASAKRKLVAVHFEYLVHPEVESWRRNLYPGAGLRFRGNFFLSRPDHTGIPSMDNLGCHLAAIREYAVPAAEIGDIQCLYERSDERLVWLEQEGKRVACIDLLQGGGRIIQDFMKKVEAALDQPAFPFDLHFALSVAKRLDARKASRTAESA